MNAFNIFLVTPREIQFNASTSQNKNNIDDDFWYLESIKYFFKQVSCSHNVYLVLEKEKKWCLIVDQLIPKITAPIIVQCDFPGRCFQA